MSTICSVCLARNTEPTAHTDAVRAGLIRWLLTHDGRAHHAGRSDAYLLKTHDTIPQQARRQADALLQMLALISKPAPTDPPF